MPSEFELNNLIYELERAGLSANMTTPMIWLKTKLDLLRRDQDREALARKVANS